MITINQGQKFTNLSNRAMYYTLTYLNCFDLRQTDFYTLEIGQTLELFNAGSKAYIYTN
jgi:hypothetical protein